MVALNFDATTVEPQKNFTLLPPGRYVCKIVDSEMKPTKDGTGQYLQLKHEVIDGEHAGVAFTNNLNLENANPQTVEIAYRTLSTICHHIGKTKIKDSKELHNQPIVVTLAVKSTPKNDGSGNFDSNEVKGYDKATADSTSSSQPQTTATSAAPLPGSNVAAPGQSIVQPTTSTKPKWATRQ